ncbi:leucine-rich repeat serine/threonine-protein kinase 1-like isoform X2 [Dysidea avara]|uniref:leucine-rich repeat serine/threonine-protein kinase 1-like isoform X2 n=1 Tax=Dysidea avara TaxID=196820 RepID=UPI00331D7445
MQMCVYMYIRTYIRTCVVHMCMYVNILLTDCITLRRLKRLQNKEDKSKQENDLMLTIFELIKNGANPTIRSAIGQQPKHLALTVGFDLGVVLLDLCEIAWINQRQGGNTNRTIVMEDIQELIKTKLLPQLYRKLACWSLKTNKFQIFEWILKPLNDPKITQYCIEANEEDGVSLYHLAASADSPAALELLLKHVSPAEIVNSRQAVDGNNCITPLSLILSGGHVKHIELLINYNLYHADTKKLTKINLSDTKIEEFSLSVLNFSSVQTLILDNTGLKSLTWDGILPRPDIKELKLKEFKATHNQLTELPSDLFTFPKLKILNVCYNHIEKLPDNWWQGLLLKSLDVSHNLLEELPLPDNMEQEDRKPDLNHHSLCGRSELVFNDLPKIPTHYGVTTQEEYLSPLQKLMLSNNHIRTFPVYLSCCVPLLQTLDLSYNRLTKVASINDIPLSLERLNVSHNHLGADGDTIFFVSFERRPCAATFLHKDEHRKCHHRGHTTLPKLCTLNLSSNKDLKKIFVHSKLPTVDVAASFLSGKYMSIHLFFPQLSQLDVSYCSLTEMPKHFSRMKSLSQLNISGNTNLKIPAEICQLRNMFEFEYEDINDDEIVSKLNQFQRVRDKIEFLNPLYRDKNNCFPPSVKLMFLGSKGHGRSTLLKFLKLNLTASGASIFMWSLFNPDSPDTLNPTESGTTSCSESLDIGVWNCDYLINGQKLQKKTSSLPNQKSISFHTWDFSGDEKCIQQCFFTPSAIYVICFKATDGVRGVVELEDWLLAIKARAPMSKVVIVATHNDQLSKKSKERERISEAVHCLYDSKSKVYPKISAVEFVACHEGKRDFSDIIKLTQILCDVATKIETFSAHRVDQKVKLMQQQVPKGFVELQEHFVGQRIENNDSLKESVHFFAWNELKQLLKERLTYLVPSSVHFMDETFMNEIVEDAVNYFIGNGTLIHYNSPGLSDLYFVDPPWLYDLLSSVVTVDYCVSWVWNRGGRHNGKLSRIHLEEMLSERGLLPEYIGSFVKLLCNFEIAVPLDANTLLIPSLIDEKVDKRSRATAKYTFPRKNVKKYLSEDLNVEASIFSAKMLPAVTRMVHTKRQLTLHSTGVCYRRIVLFHHIPISFWPRLLARCLSSASQFYKIILNNCVSDMPFQRLTDPGDVVIGHIPCQWFYWKNGIMLDFDNRTLLFVSNLVNPNVVDGDGNRQASSSTVKKIRKMALDTTGKDFSTFNNGFEINVPDYILESSSTDLHGPKRVSSLMSSQIMSHVLEVIDEVLREWLEGDSGLYSNDSTIIQQFVPCPYCFGDSKTPQDQRVEEDSGFDIKLNRDKSLELSGIHGRRVMTCTSPVNEMKAWVNKVPSCLEKETDLFKGFPGHDQNSSRSRIAWNLGTAVPAGFTFKHCIWAADNLGNTIMCPNHDSLKLSDLIPDVMFRDMLHTTIDKSALRGKHEILGQGGFGTVYRVKFYKEDSGTLDDVVVKVISTPNMMEDQSESLEFIVDKYADIRLELNKLCSSSHKNIVHFIGITMDPLSFVMEWAPLGSLKKILMDYRKARCSLCPESVLLSIQQISCALNYLHQEKSIVHFDIKPDNVLVFQFPPHGHQCYVQGKPLKSVSCVHCKVLSNKPGVLVKLADLGISAFVGPGGFHRKSATPGHTAPEAIRYKGKEQMTEKVDIFSLGVSLYELMTLRELPPDGVHPGLFDTEMEMGRRPQFVSVDPKYPQVLYDCLVSCWAQEYTNRPSAEELTNLMVPENLSIVNSYNLGDLQVTDVLVVIAEDGNASLWIASNLILQYIEENVLSVYTVVDSESGPSFKMDVYHTTLKSCIKSLCQVDDKHVWIACEDGSIAICQIETSGILKYCSFEELQQHGQSLRVMLSVADNLVLVGYHHGMLAFIENNESLLDAQESSMLYSMMSTIKSICLKNIGCLNTIETFEKDGGQQVIWCGCDNGLIYIVESLNTWKETFKDHQMKDLTTTPLKVDSVSDKLDPKLGIVQLNSVFSTSVQKVVVYALHGDCDNSASVISCWFTDQTLHRIINLHTPAITISPQSTGVYVAEYGGKLYILDSNGDRTPLPGYHSKATVYLTSIHASISLNGFISSIGHQQDPSNDIPCRMLISVGRGCGGPLQQYSQPSTSKLDTTYAILHTIPL